MLRTFLLLCISRIITKAPSLAVAVEMLKAFFTDYTEIIKIFFEGNLYTFGLDASGYMVVIAAILVLLVVGILQESGMKIRETLAKQNVLFRWFIYLVLIFSVLIFGIYGSGFDSSAFIYGQY